MPRDEPMLDYAEEDDLFGSDNEINDAVPLPAPLPTPTPLALHSASPPRPGPSQAGPSTYDYPIRASERKSVALTVQERTNELLSKKRSAIIREFHDTGVNTLKTFCMNVVRVNSARIWDIGDMEYSVVAPFINDLPQDQLVEIEDNSPHVKKDTDWLWEMFMLQDYPLFHERCRERQGQPRDRGWRRMYQKAKDDAIERQASAIERVTERYKELEQERASKRIVMIDQVPPAKRPRRGGAPIHSSERKVSGLNGTQHAIAKARQEAHRTRIAMTHAAGRFVPPPPSRSRPHGHSEIFKNPYTSSNNGQAADRYKSDETKLTGPRIPRPRPRVDRHPHAAEATVSSSPSGLIPGSTPTSQLDAERATLPEHLRGIVPAAPPPKPSAPFRLPDEPRSKFKTVKRPEVPNFQLPQPTPSKVVVDFFGDSPDRAPKGLLESLNRSHTLENDTTKSPHTTSNDARGPRVTSSPLSSPKVRPPVKDVMDILFTKKKKPNVVKRLSRGGG